MNNKTSLFKFSHLSVVVVCFGLLFLQACQTTGFASGQEKVSAEPAFDRTETTDEQKRQKTTPFAVLKKIAGAVEPKRQLLCKVDSGNAKYEQGWYDFKTTEFAITKGEKLRIEIPRKRGDGVASFLGRFDEGGQKLVFCPYLDVPEGQKIPCASFYTLEEDLELGIRRTFDVPKAVRGGYLFCKYEAEPE